MAPTLAELLSAMDMNLPTSVHIYHVLKGPKKEKHAMEPDPWQVIELGADIQAALMLVTNLDPFADILDTKIEDEQRTFWRRYAFNELPVELINHLYEQFLPNQPGVVYTPPFLVSFILDEVLPLSERTPGSFRILDPACGSGVFLIGAFKRLVYRWRKQSKPSKQRV